MSKRWISNTQRRSELCRMNEDRTIDTLNCKIKLGREKFNTTFLW